MQKIDLVRASTVGLIVGGMTGLALGLFLYAIFSVDPNIGDVDKAVEVLVVFCAITLSIVFAATAHAVNRIIEAIGHRQ